MSDLKDYIREEIEEEQRLGYLSQAEGERRLGLLASGPPAAGDAAARPQAGPPLRPSRPMTAGSRCQRSSSRRQRSRSAATSRVPPGPGPRPASSSSTRTRGSSRTSRASPGAWPSPVMSRSPPTCSPGAAPGRSPTRPRRTAALGKIDRQRPGRGPAGGTQTHLAEGLTTSTDRRLPRSASASAGGLTWRLAARRTRGLRRVPSRSTGPSRRLRTVPGINCPRSSRSAASSTSGSHSKLPVIEEAMSSHTARTSTRPLYQDAQHAFHNDTNPKVQVQPGGGGAGVGRGA